MSRREKLRNSMIEEIKTLARVQMAAQGASGLSLSGIAKQLDVSAPALYRYFSGRDELITALILDAFNHLADALERVAQEDADGSAVDRLLSVLLTYREWALANPVDFQLIYGTPIPDYHAPEDSTAAAARRGFATILTLLDEIRQQNGLLSLSSYLEKPAGLVISLGENGPYPDEVLYLGVVGWTRIHGMIMLELFHHTTALVNNPEAFYRNEVIGLLRSVGLKTTR